MNQDITRLSCNHCYIMVGDKEYIRFNSGKWISIDDKRLSDEEADPLEIKYQNLVSKLNETGLKAHKVGT